jgi:hypothetical protein
VEGDLGQGAVAILGQVELDVVAAQLGVILARAVEQEGGGGFLLDGAGVAELVQLGGLAGGAAIELGDHEAGGVLRRSVTGRSESARCPGWGIRRLG